MKILKNVSGIISALISLMLVSILSLGTLVIETGRFQAAKTQLAEVNISAATSMIAAFDADLYERYGLLAIDTERFTESRVKDYIDFNSDYGIGYAGNNVTRLYAVDSVEMNGIYNFTYPSVLKRQILTRAKYTVVPADYTFNYYNGTSFITELNNKAEYVKSMLYPSISGNASAGTIDSVPAEMRSALDALNKSVKTRFEKSYDVECNVTIGSGGMSLLPSKTGTVTSTIPAEDMELINQAVSDTQSVLGTNGAFLDSGEVYTETDVTVDVSAINTLMNNFQSASNLTQVSSGVANSTYSLINNIKSAFNTLSSADLDSNLLLNSYIAGYFSNRNVNVKGYTGAARKSGATDDNTSFAGACTEYIFGGNSKEVENQKIAYRYAFALRYIYNLYNVFNLSTTFDHFNRSNVAAHVSWAFYETVIDMELLTHFKTTVPLNKYQTILPVNNPSAVASAFTGSDDNALLESFKKLGIYSESEFNIPGVDDSTYSDVIAIALWLVPNSTKLLRIADLVQLEMRYREKFVEKKSVEFLMSEQNTYCRVKTNAKYRPVLPVIAVGESGGLSGFDFQSIKYVGY